MKADGLKIGLVGFVLIYRGIPEAIVGKKLYKPVQY